MSVDTATRLQDIHSRMFIGQLDQLPNIDSGLVANQRQFVGKSDLYIARRVFRQLTHLGRLGIRLMQITFHEERIKLHGLLCRSLINPSDHPIVIFQFIKEIAG